MSLKHFALSVWVGLILAGAMQSAAAHTVVHVPVQPDHLAIALSGVGKAVWPEPRVTAPPPAAPAPPPAPPPPAPAPPAPAPPPAGGTSSGATRSVNSTCYTLPGIMASGKRVYSGAVAMNGVAFGTRYQVLSGPLAGNTYTVEDRIGHGSQFDIWMASGCRQYGRRQITIRKVG